jgi:hypothetical protein
MQPATRLRLVSALLGSAIAACTAGTTGPRQSRVDGTYSATQFVLITPDSVFDQLADGVRLTITLNRDGTTTGTLTVVDALLDLAGEWDTAGGFLQVHTTTPTFLTRAPLAISRDHLQGDFNLEGGTIHLTLSK